MDNNLFASVVEVMQHHYGVHICMWPSYTHTSMRYPLCMAVCVLVMCYGCTHAEVANALSMDIQHLQDIERYYTSDDDEVISIIHQQVNVVFEMKNEFAREHV